MTKQHNNYRQNNKTIKKQNKNIGMCKRALPVCCVESCSTKSCRLRSASNAVGIVPRVCDMQSRSVANESAAQKQQLPNTCNAQQTKCTTNKPSHTRNHKNTCTRWNTQNTSQTNKPRLQYIQVQPHTYTYTNTTNNSQCMCSQHHNKLHSLANTTHKHSQATPGILDSSPA